MSDANLSNPTPQFGTAEYVGNPGNDHCQFCHQPIAGTYYRANQSMACGSCADKMRFEMAGDTHAAFVRALTAGIAAAMAGLIAYAVLTIMLQGWQIGYMSLGVGWLVGTAMMKASNGTGGRRYQIAAVLLTYGAVSMAAIPIALYFQSQNPRQTEQQKLEAEQRQLESESGQEHQQPAAEPRRATLPTLAGLVVRLALLGLASPFLELRENAWGAIGLLILFVGIRIAWRITAGRPLQIYGPFHDSPRPAL